MFSSIVKALLGFFADHPHALSLLLTAVVILGCIFCSNWYAVFSHERNALSADVAEFRKASEDANKALVDTRDKLLYVPTNLRAGADAIEHYAREKRYGGWPGDTIGDGVIVVRREAALVNNALSASGSGTPPIDNPTALLNIPGVQPVIVWKKVEGAKR